MEVSLRGAPNACITQYMFSLRKINITVRILLLFRVMSVHFLSGLSANKLNIVKQENRLKFGGSKDQRDVSDKNVFWGREGYKFKVSTHIQVISQVTFLRYNDGPGPGLAA